MRELVEILLEYARGVCCRMSLKETRSLGGVLDCGSPTGIRNATTC